MNQLHEDKSDLKPETLDKKRALESLIEELEAVDWYMQRADATQNQQLKAILIHNANEEKEHAAMLLEWLRRQDNDLSKELKDYLFTKKPISDIEHK